MVNIFRLMILLVTGLTLSCAEKGLVQDNPQESFANAKSSYDDHHYEIAIKKLSEFKSRFPYSRYAIEAELLIANSYFETHKFTEAGVAYEQFVKLHPKHEKIDFALFRVGLSYWKDAPTEIDREQEYTQIAITKWSTLIKDFPQSSFTEEAKKLMELGKLRIAKAENFISRFYCRKEIWHACAYHSLILLEKHSDQKELAREAVKRAVKSLEKMAQEEPFGKEKNLFNREATREDILKKAEEIKAKYGFAE